MADIQISLLDYKDSKSITDFYNLFHPKKGRTESKFRWEFQNSPYQESVYVVAKDVQTGKIVGSQAAIPLELIDASGNVILTAKSEDTIVHPDYRGQNIFDNMYKLLFDECSKRGIKVIWGFTTAKKPFTKLGFETPYAISQSLAVFGIYSSVKYLTEYNPAKGLKASVRTLVLCVLATLTSIRFSMGNKKLSNSEMEITDGSATLNNSNLISEILSASGEYFTIRQDNTYLKWRLAENPYHQELVCVSVKLQGKPVANFSFNHHEQGVWYLIQDLYSRNLTDNEKETVVKQAISVLRQRRLVNLIRTWDFTHNKINQANVSTKKKAGFFHLTKGSLFVWKALDSSIRLKPEGFILSRIASEGTI